jgi:hypothetical protein
MTTAPDQVMQRKPPLLFEPRSAKRGRPRKRPSNAIKQAAYNRRKQEPERRALIEKIKRRVRGAQDDDFVGLTIRKLKWLWKFTSCRIS